ncbi:MAG: hypothetical protein RR047_01360 [Bacilli bacterium]
MTKMININKILYCVLIIIVFIFLCSWYDEFCRNKLYNSNYSYENSTKLVISSKINLDSKKIEEISADAKQYHILIEKKVLNKKNNVVIHYLNTEDYRLLCSLFNIKYSTNIDGISTTDKFKTNTSKSDFLQNDLHIYKLFDSYYNEQYNYTGEYQIFYNSKDSLNKFIDVLAEKLEIDSSDLLISGNSLSKSNFEIFKNIYIICIIFIAFSIFISSLFSTFKESNEIGIYKLLGFSNLKIIKHKFLADLKIYLLITFVIYFIVNFFVQGNNIIFILYSAFASLIILFIKILISSISIFIINNKIRLINLVKKESLTSGIMGFNQFFKIITFGIILTISLFVGIQLKLFMDRKEELDSFSKYSEYAVFSQFYSGNDTGNLTGGSDELDISELELFKHLEKQDVRYADFRTYFFKTKDDENFYKTLTSNGNKRFRYGIIDYNYLSDLNLIDTNTKLKIEIGNNSTENIFLIPESLKLEVENFKKFYYEYYDKKDNDWFIIYEDSKIPSLSPEIAANNGYLIDSPILRVITSNNVSLREVSVYGVGYDTPMKIKIDSNKSKQEFYDTIYYKLFDLKLDDNLDINTLFTFGELFNIELRELQNQIITFVFILCLLLIIYIYISFQSFVLYLKDKYKEIAIKKLNGYSDIKVFINYIITNFIITSFIMIVVFLIFNKSYHPIEFLKLFLLINLIEEFLNIIIIKVKFNKFIVNAIKGEKL